MICQYGYIMGAFFYAILINRGIGTKNTKEGV